MAYHFLSLGSGILVLIFPYLFPTLDNSTLIFLVGLGFLLIGIFLGQHTAVNTSDKKLEKIRTLCRFQFYGNETVPAVIHSENIFYYYSLWNASARIFNPMTNEELVSIPKTWAIILIFDKSIPIKSVNISFNSPGFPSYEVKSYGSRHAILSIAGNPPAGFLEIESNI